MQSDDKHWQLQILTGLFDFVKEETHRTPALHLQGFVNLVELIHILVAEPVEGRTDGAALRIKDRLFEYHMDKSPHTLL
jgi:hypothetical protein